ncbi:Hydroxyacylglutathione hydrolase [Shimia thalassica]|uniref:Hydroxyacylglutathione hydrolase n=1 Tax=Shimia thalassica TaxID=1715693 RepID=A0A0P1I2A8_9RHOB|nr:hydroxyacylglutathione hydrolase [Shimia thalassica]CUJ85541.1 Hydroxyacylglutathione hydrolase [Shimia thalassica]
MPLEIVTIPCLSDNYSFLIHNASTGETAVVDVPDAAPISEALKSRGWTLSHVLLTHHHWDHIDGLPDLLKDHPAQVIGAKADAHRLPALDIAVSEGDPLIVCGEAVQVFDVSGHTIGHVAFYLADTGAVFTADSLMALGCGRLFEGSPAQMFESLTKLAGLPESTIVCSGHEYTESNARFALTVDPNNPDLLARVAAIREAREKGLATVPSLLSEEMATNPFLRGHDPALQRAVGMDGATAVDVFTEVRKRKDNF